MGKGRTQKCQLANSGDDTGECSTRDLSWKSIQELVTRVSSKCSVSERNCNMTLPGFGGDEIKSYKKNSKNFHWLIKKSIVASEIANAKSSMGQGGGHAEGHLSKAHIANNIIGFPKGQTPRYAKQHEAFIRCWMFLSMFDWEAGTASAAGHEDFVFIDGAGFY
ncbi:hypothetical protein LguiA_015979 [Lonicera macranthoides]